MPIHRTEVTQSEVLKQIGVVHHLPEGLFGICQGIPDGFSHHRHTAQKTLGVVLEAEIRRDERIFAR